MSSPQVKFVLDAAWRRKWLLVLPPILGFTVGWAVVRKMPRTYDSYTTIVVEGQRVSEKLAEATITAGLSELLANIKPIIFRPENLDPVARELELVSEEATRRQLDEARATLGDRIRIEENAKQSNFTITVSDLDPRRAARAANLVAKLFLDQYQDQRTLLAGETVGFFKAEKEQAAKELEAAETALSDFQRRNYESLPARVTGYQSRLELLRQRIQQDSDEILAKEGQISFLKTQDRADVTLSTIAGTLPPGAEGVQRKLDQARADLSGLLVKYSEQHPDIRAKREEIKGLEQVYARALAGGEATTDDPAAPPANTAEAQVARLEQDIVALKARRDGYNTETEALYARMRNAPFVAQELGELETIRNEKRATYNQLVEKERQSRAGMKIEEAGQGARLRQVSQAYPSSKPSSPVVPNFLFGGAALGLLLGLGIAFLLEQLDPSLRSEERFRHAFPDVPLLEAIPSLGPDPATMKGKKGKGGKGMKPGRGKAAAAVAVLVVTGGLFS